MPSWEEYRKIAKERGSLAFELYVVESTKVGSPEQMQQILPDHLAYQQQLEAEGKLFLAGPRSDEAGQEMSGDGLIIYRASSLEEARVLAEQDPMHAQGARQFRIRKWLVNEGSLSFGLKLSGQKVTLS